MLKKNPFFWMIAGILATWRITSILQREEIASPIRRAVGATTYEPDDGDPDHFIYADNFIGKVFYCFWCGSVWGGIAVTILLLIFPPLILPFALSAGAIAFKHWLEDFEPPTYIENMWVMNDEDTSDEYGDLGEEDAG